MAKGAATGVTDPMGGPLCGQVKDLEADYTEGLHVRLDQADGRWWCVFEPATIIDLRVVEEGGEDDEPAT